MNPQLAFRIYHDGTDWVAIVTGSPRYSGLTGIETHPITAIHELIAAIYMEDYAADAAEDLRGCRPLSTFREVEMGARVRFCGAAPRTRVPV